MWNIYLNNYAYSPCRWVKWINGSSGEEKSLYRLQPLISKGAGVNTGNTEDEVVRKIVWQMESCAWVCKAATFIPHSGFSTRFQSSCFKRASVTQKTAMSLWPRLFPLKKKEKNAESCKSFNLCSDTVLRNYWCVSSLMECFKPLSSRQCGVN